MAPRTRARSTAKVGNIDRLQRQVTQFGELETTPTNHHHQLPGFLPQLDENPPVSAQQQSQSDILDEGLNDNDMMELDLEVTTQVTQKKTIAWSDTGSLTRRSSPVRSENAPADDIWNFCDDESLAPFSSPKTSNALPDIMPLPPESQLHGKDATRVERHIDFSETASTARRSSPFGLGEVGKDIWDFDTSPSTAARSNNQRESTMAPNPVLSPTTAKSPYQFMEDLYDATPPPTWKPNIKVTAAEEETEAGEPTGKQSLVALLGEDDSLLVKSMDTLPHSEEQRHHALIPQEGTVPKQVGVETTAKKVNGRDLEKSDGLLAQHKPPLSDISLPPSHSAGNWSSKKRKQRAKEPIQFDETTLEVKKRPPPKKQKAASRLPIVSALQESAKASSSPVVGERKKPTARQTRAKKPAKKTSDSQKFHETPVTNGPTDDNNNDTERCLAPSKLPTKREVEANNESKVTPCSGKDTGRKKALPIVEPTEVSSDLLGGLDLDDSPFPPFHQAKASWSGKTREKQGTKQPNVEKYSTKSVSHLASPEASIGTYDIPVTKETAYVSRNIVMDVASTSRKVDMYQMAEKPDRAMLVERDIDLSIKKTPNSRWQEPPKLSSVAVVDKPTTRDVANGQQLVMRRNRSRQFSISLRGSPVSLKDAIHNPVILVEDGPLNRHDEDLGNFRQHLSFSERKPEHPVAMELPFSSNESSASRPVRPVEREAADSKGVDSQAPASALIHELHRRRNLLPNCATGARRSEMDDELKARILTSLLEQADATLKGHHADGKQKDLRISKEVRAHVNDISDQLHRVIDQLTSYMEGKEETAHKVANAYRRSGSECVARLHRRCLRERDALVQTFAGDAARFEKKLDSARSAIETSRLDREKSIADLEECMAQRQIMYQRASTSLRALHGQLLSRLET